MIISASRRTDIPAFYADWFLRRIRDEYCLMANPFYPTRLSRISLAPEDVDVIVFWTRNPSGLLGRLRELDERGYRYYFLYTLVDYPAPLEPNAAPLHERIGSFIHLSDAVGPGRVVWRYDPIVLCERTAADFHRASFERIAMALEGRTMRCVMSFLTDYPKVRRRMANIWTKGFALQKPEDEWPQSERLLGEMALCAHSRGMEITSCAESRNLHCYGIRPGSCIDSELIRRLFGIETPSIKDQGQRPFCRCAVSKDIGAYDTCPAGCLYCYASQNPDTAFAKHRSHDPLSPSLP